MASRGYCTTAQVAALLGTTFSPEQAAACDERIVVLEAHLDRVLRWRWLVPAADADLVQAGPLYGPTIALEHVPVAAVTAVTVYGPTVGATGAVLVLDQTYALIGPTAGIVSVAGSGYGAHFPWPERYEAAYTLVADAPVPADVSYACALTVAAWTAPTLPAGSVSGAGSTIAAVAAGVKRYSVGQELTVEFAERASTAPESGGLPTPLPAAAVALLVPYGYPRGARLVFA